MNQKASVKRFHVGCQVTKTLEEKQNCACLQERNLISNGMHPVDLGVTYVHYERLMGLDRQRSEAFGPVHYGGYI